MVPVYTLKLLTKPSERQLGEQTTSRSSKAVLSNAKQLTASWLLSTHSVGRPGDSASAPASACEAQPQPKGPETQLS